MLRTIVSGRSVTFNSIYPVLCQILKANNTSTLRVTVVNRFGNLIDANEKNESWVLAEECHHRLSLYSSYFRRLGASKSLQNGMVLHTQMTAFGIEQQDSIQGSILYMYLQCGALAEAWQMFNTIQNKNQFCWNVMIHAHVQYGLYEVALKLFQEMHMEGTINPDSYTFVSILSACAGIDIAMLLHFYVVSSALELHVVVATSLISIYCKHGKIEDASILFETIPERNIITWNTILAALSHNNKVEQVVQLYIDMQQRGLFPDKVTYISVISACSIKTLLWEGQKLYTVASNSRIKQDIVMSSALVDMYGKCGDLAKAENIFDGMEERNPVSWTSLVSAYSQYGKIDKSLQLFHQLYQECNFADKIMFLSIISALVCESNLAQGKSVHASVAVIGLEKEVEVSTALINLYCKSGCLEMSRKIFNEMKDRNELSWSSMINAYIEHAKEEEAFELFGKMLSVELIPNELLVGKILHQFGNQGSKIKGRIMHAYIIIDGLDFSVVNVPILNMYSRFGQFFDAYYIFDTLSERTVAVWNAMMCISHDEINTFDWFAQMQLEGILPDKYTFTKIVSACSDLLTSITSKQIISCALYSGYELDAYIGTMIINEYTRLQICGKALTVFDEMHTRTLFAWNSIIKAFVHDRNATDIFQLFWQMQLEGEIADKFIYLTLLETCTDQVLLTKGKLLHVFCLLNQFHFDVSVGTALVNLYGRCGRPGDAKKVFDELRHSNLLSWTCMISLFALHGFGNDAVAVFCRMLQERMVPDKVTYTSILSACAHNGMNDDGRCFLLYMDNQRNGFPVVDHFNCILDLLGKAGQFKEAETMIENMPVQPSIGSWTILLDSSRNILDVVQGYQCAKYIFEIDQEDVTSFVTLSNVYFMAKNNDLTA